MGRSGDHEDEWRDQGYTRDTASSTKSMLLSFGISPTEVITRLTRVECQSRSVSSLPSYRTSIVVPRIKRVERQGSWIPTKKTTRFLPTVSLDTEENESRWFSPLPTFPLPSSPLHALPLTPLCLSVLSPYVGQILGPFIQE